MKFKKKPVAVEAHRWFKNGDHPEDGDGKVEGKVVRFFRHPDLPDGDACPECSRVYFDHGWIDTREGGHRVCPGDWIITGVKRERYPCKPDIFELTYDKVQEHDVESTPTEPGAGGFLMFAVMGHPEFIKLCPNGDIYVKGKLIENDMLLVRALREFAAMSTFGPNTKKEYEGDENGNPLSGEGWKFKG